MSQELGYRNHKYTQFKKFFFHYFKTSDIFKLKSDWPSADFGRVV